MRWKTVGKWLAVPKFVESFNKLVADLGLTKEQIYNADETGLIFKNLNSRTLVASHEKSAPGRKNSKERITIMPCVNATGTRIIFR